LGPHKLGSLRYFLSKLVLAFFISSFKIYLCFAQSGSGTKTVDKYIPVHELLAKDPNKIEFFILGAKEVRNIIKKIRKDLILNLLIKILKKIKVIRIR
jgi:hypothetical protein